MMNVVFKDAIFVNYQYANIVPSKMIIYQILFVMNAAWIINATYVIVIMQKMYVLHATNIYVNLAHINVNFVDTFFV
jgi:hypothetical protein